MNAELIIVNSKEGVSNEEEMAADIMSLVTVYSARLHGKRGGEASRIELTAELRAKVFELHQMGLSQTKNWFIRFLRTEVCEEKDMLVLI